MAAPALKLSQVPSNDVKNKLTDGQLLLLNRALSLVDMRYRECITPHLCEWMLAHAELLPRYDDRLASAMTAVFNEYRTVGADDERKDRLFSLAAHRFYRENGQDCAPPQEVRDEVADTYGNRGLLELRIAFGYLAMAWQVANFPKDIIMTRTLMTRRYPIQEGGKGKKPISPN